MSALDAATGIGAVAQQGKEVEPVTIQKNEQVAPLLQVTKIG
jgi:hypothetical protein